MYTCFHFHTFIIFNWQKVPQFCGYRSDFTPCMDIMRCWFKYSCNLILVRLSPSSGKFTCGNFVSIWQKELQKTRRNFDLISKIQKLIYTKKRDVEPGEIMDFVQQLHFICFVDVIISSVLFYRNYINTFYCILICFSTLGDCKSHRKFHIAPSRYVGGTRFSI